MNRLAMLIVADDLTGAADGAAVCLRQGLSCFVAIDERAAIPAVDVVAIDADTRSMNAAAAAEETRRRVEAIGPSDAPLLFKKIDSTLRGQVAAELAATLHARRAATGRTVTAVLAPAFPAAGRTTVGGRVFIHDRPLEQTELWQREGWGPDASLAGVMDAAGLSYRLVGLDDVRSKGLASSLRASSGSVDVLVCDAQTDDDLAMIASASLPLGEDAIWSGSAGLAGHLVHAAGPVPSARPAMKGSLPIGPVLFLVGSLSSVSRDQATALVDEAGLLPLPVPVSQLVRGQEALDQAGWSVRLAEAFQASRDVVILPEPDVPIDPRHAEPLRAGLAELAAPFAERIGGLFVTGGETARAVLLAMGVTGLHLHAELEPGVPLSTAQATHPFAVVTKAGAFGHRRTMLNAYRALRERAGPALFPSHVAPDGPVP